MRPWTLALLLLQAVPLSLGVLPELWVGRTMNFFADYLHFYGVGGVYYLKPEGTGEEIRILLFSDSSFGDFLAETYLPLLNLVQIAAVSDEGISLWEQHQVNRNLPRRVRRIGVWRPSDNDLLCATCHTTLLGDAQRRNDPSAVAVRSGLMGSEFWRPATILNWDADGQLSVSGSFIEVVQYFQSNLNFSYYLIIRRPGLNTGLTWSSYTQEFSTWSWVSAGVTLLLLACAFSVVTVHQPRSPSAVPFPDALLTVFGAMCQQGSTFQARGTPTRIAFLTIFLFGTVLYIFYCTFLISALSVVKSNLPFTNLAGLLRVGTHQLVVASGTIVEATIKTSTSPLYKRAWQNILDGDPDSFASHYTDCALRALKKRHACLLEISEYMYEHSKNLQLVALTEEKYGRFSVGIAVADKSPLKDLFNVQ
ncbi:hypothetical protein C7M84_006578 [Penaeus vannamei]|uniref:Ionotropic glutamate receptor C-terminal domain-containing protein n=1 Tax=Penaeus vannamei TaxID=6689 RepID=A0A423TEM2_PENVA|nr:hypothetical protein C7M84_006578 [Penaeus vannamei]